MPLSFLLSEIFPKEPSLTVGEISVTLNISSLRGSFVFGGLLVVSCNCAVQVVPYGLVFERRLYALQRFPQRERKYALSLEGFMGSRGATGLIEIRAALQNL